MNARQSVLIMVLALCLAVPAMAQVTFTVDPEKYADGMVNGSDRFEWFVYTNGSQLDRFSAEKIPG